MVGMGDVLFLVEVDIDQGGELPSASLDASV
jgi:hypothetical protein